MSRILARYMAQLGALRSSAGAAVGQAWDGLGSYDRVDIDRFLGAALPVVEASQAAAANLTDAYLAAELGRPPIGIDPATVTGSAVRTGVPADVVYRRPFIGVWSALKSGTAWADAVAAGGARATQTAHTDVQLAMRAAGRTVLGQDGRVTGYRRVTTGPSCGLCVKASLRPYNRDDLLPVHTHCRCGIAPIIGSRDPGAAVNRQTARSLTATDADDRRLVVGEDGAVRLPDVVVHEHGELGPLLAAAGQTFTEL